jgi:hypothetical protein
MALSIRRLALVAISTTLVAGCAADGSLTTSSIGSSGQTAAASKIDPACLALTTKIDALRQEGITERIEKASTGKSTSVSVKRESLAKIAELDKANAEFQAKCATVPRANKTAAAAVPPVAQQSPPPVATAAATTAAKP